MEMKYDISFIELFNFLNKIDNLFPIKLSDKQDLNTLAAKFKEFGTLNAVYDKDTIVALLSGYTNDDENGIAYVSVLAVLPEYQGRGYASTLLIEFEKICKQKNMRRIELYTHKTNFGAIEMYKKCGFLVNENNKTRPDDIKFYKDL